MSRIGKKPIPIPSSVSVELVDDGVSVKGKHGEDKQSLPPGIRVEVKDGELLVHREGDEPRHRAFHGLARSLLANGVKGVEEPYEKKLEIVGIGYRAVVEGKEATFSVGHSHPVKFTVPDGIELTVAKQTMVTVRGIDKQQVGQVAANIRDIRRPDVYKGKGIRYSGERVRQKVGKSGASGAK